MLLFHGSLRALILLALLSSLRLLRYSHAASASTRYVPGTPGGPWTREEMLIVKAKLWRIFDMATKELHEMLMVLCGDTELCKGPFWYEVASTSRMSPSMIRLAFHGCVTERDTRTGGCDGCLYWDGIGRLYLDYHGQQAIPLEGAPNFNNGLGPAVRILEEMYTNPIFPDSTPSLPASLRDTGKSRADLWSFAGLVGVEHGIFTNNMVCMFADHEWNQRANWGQGIDSLATNSFWGKHCLQNQGTPKCMIDIQNPAVFRSGRIDCVPKQLYKKLAGPCAYKRLEIVKEEDCEDAAKEVGVAQWVFKADAPRCSVNGTNEALCHVSVQEKYNSHHGYYVDPPLGNPPGFTALRVCEPDLEIQDEAECNASAKYLHLDVGDHIINISGCFAISEYTWGGGIKIRIWWGEGQQALPTFDANVPPTGDSNMRSVCRQRVDKAAPYMAATWGSDPSGQKNGANTVKWFKEDFGLTPKQTVAIMGGHTMGRFHARQNIIRYVWIRNGALMFNNDYYRLLSAKRDYRFTDWDCGKVGDAFGQPPQTMWHVERRGEFTNYGPATWLLYRHICHVDCGNLAADTMDPCCTGLPAGAMCMPDNNRTKDMDAVLSDDDTEGGCERFNSEGGNHELALPAEIGLYFKFETDEHDVPTGCPGFDNFHDERWYCKYHSGQDCHKGPPNCPLNDDPADDNMKLFEVIDHFADNQDAFIETFMPAWQKVLENGYNHAQLSAAEDVTTNVICPSQYYGLFHHSLKYWSCFSVDRLSHPFVIISDLDKRILQLNETIGGMVMGADWDANQITELAPNQVWYLAEAEFGDQLINGVFHFGIGKLRYELETSKIVGDEGIIARNWQGLTPEIVWLTEDSWYLPLQTWRLEPYHNKVLDMSSAFG